MIPFISVADLEQAIDETVTNQDLAAIALDTACDLVRAELDRDLNYTADEEVTLDGTGTSALVLPAFPVVTASDVVVDGTAIESTRYVLDLDSGILYLTELAATWPKGRRNIAAKFSHGYAATELEVDVPNGIVRVPSDIRFVALNAARRFYVNAGVPNGSAGAVRDAIGGTDEWTPFTVPLLLTEDECYKLGPHRVRKAG